MKSTSKILLGVITAAAAGAVIGMMFAPDKGEEIRSKVRKTANELADELLNAIRRGKNQYEDTKDELRNKAYDLKGKAQQKFDDLASDAEDQYNSTKKKLQMG
ncbi:MULTISPECIES: YtxH domain-containing protein [Emticicia]|uniref:YtxH domain-containing protein n=1 Tax=Emticicia TaxID=312278 RepID=UPI0020A14939|nr:MULTISPECIES: YtxH domain-containing protein [Emticicia]UTA68325.1 YtxH domain-containing protein [Emticicia sp. 21SJ11W-3]